MGSRLQYGLFCITAMCCSVSALVITEAKPSMEKDQHLFENKSQVDVVSILMLLGEATIWKAIWGRTRSRRYGWRHWIFAVSPGWTPLAASLFAAMYGSLGPTNLVYNRPPESCIDTGLILTNLNSGASHAATNTVLQNIWHTWNKGARFQQNPRKHEYLYDLTKETGVTNINLDNLHLDNPRSFWLQCFSLTVQIIGSFVLGFFGWTFETFFVILVALASQLLLLSSIIPREKAWIKTTRGYRPSPIMLHRGLDTTAVLIVRTASIRGREVSLEEFCWDNQASRDFIDDLKPLAAGVSFALWVFHIILVGWMNYRSRYLYLAFGGLGLVTTAIEAATEPRWSRAFQSAFSHHALCAPLHSSLMSAVAVLLAGRFPGAKEAARLLYPDNSRFKDTLQELDGYLDQILCASCRQAIRYPNASQCLRIGNGNGGIRCQSLLDSQIQKLNSKQLMDGLAAVHNYLQTLGTNSVNNRPIETHERSQRWSTYSW